MNRRIMGIDPGTAIVGYGVIDQDGDRRSCVTVGAIVTAKGDPMPRRLLEIYRDVCALLAEFKPDEVAIEELFFVQNVTTGISVAMARGVIVLACAAAGIATANYAPMVVKLAVAGHGRASKREIQEAVKEALGLAKIPKPDDAADGLALALCHLDRA